MRWISFNKGYKDGKYIWGFCFDFDFWFYNLRLILGIKNILVIVKDYENMVKGRKIWFRYGFYLDIWYRNLI